MVHAPQGLGSASRLLGLQDGHPRRWGILHMLLQEAAQLHPVRSAEEPEDLRRTEQRVVAAMEAVWEAAGKLAEAETAARGPWGAEGLEVEAARAAGEARRALLAQQEGDWSDTPAHVCARHHLNGALAWLLERSDEALMMTPTKAGWLVLMTACRAANPDGAAVYLRRASGLGLLTGGYGQVVLADLSPFNHYYADNSGREHLDTALRQVWPYGGCPAVFEGFQDAEQLKRRVADSLAELLGSMALAA
ncbi:hypothetical protein GPECTOR_16g744 [Gonium pectorale]|uniref:Uncharacterized protein n=1 Tax=Gonium pectorale TaxID=33097 RepID=A0A150GL41_GONPE|nr:hypothetical protein GPECTOR_16g744 [Gonium pectorale]|eukprot:KXZ50569.1 hypothetical protein GPECTOR_16g744 [Gonium pectorale]